jgi:hypothetical protein
MATGGRSYGGLLQERARSDRGQAAESAKLYVAITRESDAAAAETQRLEAKIDQLRADMEREVAAIHARLDQIAETAAANIWTMRGPYSPSAAPPYCRGDVWLVNSTSFICIRNNPSGGPPGSDWRMVAGAGQRGVKGEKGPKGESGKIVDWKTDIANCAAMPIYPDGTLGPTLQLAELFQAHLDYRDGLS